MPHVTLVALVTLLPSLLLSTPALRAQENAEAQTLEAKVDRIFRPFAKPDAPGAVVLVGRGADIVLQRAYGAADLERKVPLTVDSVFDIGSTSKQFTAACLLLLEQEGKLALADPVKKHVAELPACCDAVTLRHLMLHTSGIPDYIGLMANAGADLEDRTTAEEALAALGKVQTLDFPTGTKWEYSNSNYFLISEVVERTGKKPLADMARERIFEPLGLVNTHIHTDCTALVANRAFSYTKGPRGVWKWSFSNWEQTGDGAVFTTVADLFRWSRNFIDGKVGGAQLLTAMSAPGALDDGTKIGYGAGLMFTEETSGRRTVSHSGAWAAYRAELLRVPAEDLVVICLCNRDDVSPSELCRRVANVVQESTPRTIELAPPLPQPTLEATVDMLCRPLVDEGYAVGFVVGVVDGERELVRGYGAVSRGGAVPDATTLFEIGSVSKVFTGVLLADAVQRGVVSLDDPAQDLLPENVRLQRHGDSQILLWHLSTHTSGLPRLPGMQGADAVDPYAHFTFERFCEVLPAAEVRWLPGSKYEYSNLGVGLLGTLLVRAAGLRSYDELLRERLTAPLGMDATAVELDATLGRRLAVPHDADCEPNHVWNGGSLAGAVGIRSCMADMQRFARAQFAPDDSPLGRALVLAQQKRYEGTGDGEMTIGLGWHFARDGETLSHNGQTGGFHAYLGVQPARRRAVCVLANTATGAFSTIGRRILNHLAGIAVTPVAIEKSVAVDRSLLQRLAGVYELKPNQALTVTLGEHGMSAQLTGRPARRFHARSPGEFFCRVVEASLVFEIDGDDVKGVVLHQNGMQIRFPRKHPAGK